MSCRIFHESDFKQSSETTLSSHLNLDSHTSVEDPEATLPKLTKSHQKLKTSEDEEEESTITSPHINNNNSQSRTLEQSRLPTREVIYQSVSPQLLKTFKGTPTENVEEFLADFIHLANSLQWDEDRAIFELRHRLDGAAKIYLKFLSGTQLQNFNSITSGLYNTFKPRSQPLRYLAELQSRVQKPNETVLEYFLDIQRLCSKIDPNMSDSIKLNSFLLGIRDPPREYIID